MIAKRRDRGWAAVAGVLVASLAALCVVAPAGPAEANQCAAACYAQHNQCRMATKGSPTCDAALTQCLRACAGKP